jgi:SAM-dependent methyltransferase
LQTARSNVEGTFVQASLDGLPEGLGTFDVVTAFEFLEHLDDPLGAVLKMKALIRPKGFLFVTVPCWFDRRLHRNPRPGTTPPIHVQFFTPASLRELLWQAGLKDVKVGGIRSGGRSAGLIGLLRLARRSLLPPMGLFARAATEERETRPAKDER